LTSRFNKGSAVGFSKHSLKSCNFFSSGGFFLFFFF
jgi:hypothetical protein